MKTQTSKQATEKLPQGSLAHHSTDTAAPSKSAHQVRPSFPGMHARIMTRAYELHIERGARDGGALEDWFDAEREILSRELPA
jgi:hypothetical protein